MVKKAFPLILVLLFSFFSIYSLLQKGLPPTHDGEYHVVRFYEFYKVSSEGILYPRWAPDLNNGFGLPLFNFVYPLPNYVSLFLHFTGFSIIDSFKLNMFIATLVGALFFYFWSKEYWEKLGGVVSSIFYSLSPYRLVDVYIRGSVGEVWAIAFFPGLLWSSVKMFKTQEKKYLVLSSFFLSFVIFSHNILAFLFFIFYFLFLTFLLFQVKDKRDFIIKSTSTIILGLGLSAIFWLPAIIEQKFVLGLDIFDLTKHFPEVYQLIIPSWGSGFSGGPLANQMSFQIGLANLTVLFLIFIFLIFKKNLAQRKIIIFFVTSFFVLFFLMLSQSSVIWFNFPFLNYFQFPWRLLSLVIIILPFLAGAIIYVISSPKYKFIISFLLIIFVLTTTKDYIRPAFYHLRDDNYYTSRENFINGTNSPGNAFNTIWLKRIPSKENEKIKILEGDAEIINFRELSASYSFEVNTNTGSSILLNTSYFPGWNVYVDEKKGKVANINGRIQAHVDKGKHSIEFRFEDTDIRKLASFVSLLSIIGLAIFSFPFNFSTVIIKR